MANRTSINKSNVFKHAWKLYRTPSYAGDKMPAKHNRARFANCLKMAWSNARYEALPVTVKIEKATVQLTTLDYAPSGISTTDKRRAIHAQISELEKLAA